MKAIHLQTMEQFEQYQAGIQAILAPYQSILLDYFSQPDHTPSEDLSGWLTENTRSCLPWIWVLTDDRQRVYALVAFTQVIPGRFAYIHGVSQPPEFISENQSAQRKRDRQAVITQFARQVLTEAFALGHFHKIKAEFEADNRGAQGFCQRMGFQREARFLQDNRIAGQWRDVLVYSLFRDQFTGRWSQPSEHFPKTDS